MWLLQTDATNDLLSQPFSQNNLLTLNSLSFKCHTPKAGHSHDSYTLTFTEHIGLNVPLVPKTLVLSLIVYTLKSSHLVSLSDRWKGREKRALHWQSEKNTETTHQLQHRHAHGHNQIHRVSKNSDQNNCHSTFQDSTKLQNRSENKEIKFTK